MLVQSKKNPGTEACAIGGAEGMGVEVAAPVLRDSGPLGSTGDESGAERLLRKKAGSGGSDGIGGGGIKIGVGSLREEGAKEIMGALGWR